jgi:hypothetical protein
LDDLHNIFICVRKDFRQSLRRKLRRDTIGGYSTVHRTAKDAA